MAAKDGKCIVVANYHPAGNYRGQCEFDVIQTNTFICSRSLQDELPCGCARKRKNCGIPGTDLP